MGDTVIRVNRLPIPSYAQDFGEKTDIFFAHDKNVDASGFSIQYMDGAWRQCGLTPNSTFCGQIQVFMWNNIWHDTWILQHRETLKHSRDIGIFVGATNLKVACAANILLNNQINVPR